MKIAIARIAAGRRLRPVNPDYVAALAASMAEIGLIEPIVVRATPNAGRGRTPYTLIDGAHRLEAARALGWAEIEAAQTAAPAQAAEIHANLVRNDLSILERADCVLALRALFEAEHGPITAGRKELAQHEPISPGEPIGQGGDQTEEQSDTVSLWSAELGRVAARLGTSRATVKRWQKLRTINARLRRLLHGSAVADELGTLMALARLSADMQALIAANIEAGKPAEQAVAEFLGPGRPAEPEPVRIRRIVVDNFARLGRDGRRRACQEMAARWRDDLEWALDHPMEEAADLSQARTLPGRSALEARR